MPEVKLLVPIDSITVEHERSSSNVKDLAESILLLGQIQPIVIDQYSRIVAGRRRLAALKLLGRTEAWVTVADTGDDKLRAVLTEGHENTCREPLVPWDALEAYERIVTIHREAAAERRGARGHARNGKPGLKPGLTIQGEARQLAAKAVGRGKDTIIMLTDIREALAHESEKVREVAEWAREHLRKPDANVRTYWQSVQDVLKSLEADEVVPPTAEELKAQQEADEEAEAEAALKEAQQRAATKATKKPTPAPTGPKVSREAAQIAKFCEYMNSFAVAAPEFVAIPDVDWEAFQASFEVFVNAVNELRKELTTPPKKKRLALVKGK